MQMPSLHIAPHFAISAICHTLAQSISLPPDEKPEAAFCRTRHYTISSLYHVLAHSPIHSTVAYKNIFNHIQVEPGTIWCFEQEHSLAGLNVTTTIRMTVVKLKSGDLLVYAPIAPTRYSTSVMCCLLHFISIVQKCPRSILGAQNTCKCVSAS